MPVVQVKSIGPRLDQTDKYIKNKKKTDKEIWEHIEMGETYDDALRSVFDYATQEDKVREDKLYYISGINVDPEHSVEEFKQVQKLYGKWESGVCAHHGWLSFPKHYPITPQECHDFAVELLKNELGDRFQIVVTTHVDREHIHSHFLINAVSFKDGKKYLGNQESLWKLRRASDELCQKYGYPVIDNPNFYGRDRGEYRAELRGERTWRDLVKLDIDHAISYSDDIDDFFTQLKRQGYLLKLDRKHPAVSPPGMTDSKGKRIYIRLRSLKDSAYTIEGITTRLRTRYMVQERVIPPGYEMFAIKGNRTKLLPRPKQRLPLYMRRYYRFMYSAGLMPKKPRYISYYQIQKYQKMAEETNDLIKYIKGSDFKGEADVTNRLSLLNDRYVLLLNKRRSLYKKRKRGANIEQEIESITNDIKALRKELGYLEKVIAIFENGEWQIEHKKSASRKGLKPSPIPHIIFQNERRVLE